MIKYYRHLLSTYFYFSPFKLLYACYNIQLELANKFSAFNWFPSTFGSLSGHHQGYVYIAKVQYSVLFIKHSHPTTEFQKILTDTTTVLEQQNKDFRFLKPFTLEIKALTSTKLILKSVLQYSNVFSYCCQI